MSLKIGGVEFGLKEQEFLAEFFAGGERIDFDASINNKRDYIVEKYRNILAKKANLSELRFSLSTTKSEEKSYNEQNGDARYSIKSSYSQYRTTAMIWANETKTKAGDLKVLYNPKTDTFNLLEADGSGDFVILKQNKNYRIVKNLYEELINEQGSNFEFNESVKEFEESIRRSDNLDLWGIENNETSDTIGRQAKSESENARIGNTKTNTGNSRYALKDSSGNFVKGINEGYNSQNDNLKYSINNNFKYTKPQYERFGWVRANDVLSPNQWKDFNSKFTSAKNLNAQFAKSLAGELIIPVNNMTEDSFGIDNALVFTKGTPASPNITKVIKINLQEETNLSLTREDIYELESRGIQTQNSTFFEVYTRANFQSYGESSDRAGYTRNASDNNQSSDRARSGKESNVAHQKISIF